MFLEHQVSILEIFLQNHVTLKTGVMEYYRVIKKNIYIYIFFSDGSVEIHGTLINSTI